MADQIISENKRAEFAGLYSEFLQSYPATQDGEKHIAFYEQVRTAAVNSFQELVKAADRGEDVTEGVLLKLLPHQDHSANQKKGAWVHHAPSITGDLKKWFENVGWTKPDDWPKIAAAILKFVRSCIEEPSKLQKACAEFDELPYSKGLQAGMMTPILNALRPDSFALINNKSRPVVNYFAGTSFQQSLVDYPAINRVAFGIVDELKAELLLPEAPNLSAADLFDMFSHWLISIKKYDFKFLALPFSRIFENHAQADRAFALLKDVIERLGAGSSHDPRLALTMPSQGKDAVIRLNYGNWLVLDFRGESGNRKRTAGMALISAEVPKGLNPPHSEPFSQNDSAPEVCVYELPISLVLDMDEELENAYRKSFEHIAKRFQEWKGCPYISAHSPELYEAVFNKDKRHKLFSSGISFKTGDYFVHSETEQHEVVLQPEYSLEQCSVETGFDEDILSRWVRAVERKGQAILYGPPGTGKTYLAHRLARHLIGGSDGFAELVQFHPAYAYEDFMQGIRPRTNNNGALCYSLTPGRFLEFCRKAVSRNGRCVMIIDEINRANLSMVFGELMYLMEYRDQAIPLAGGQNFSIPSNVLIIGTMNTADRSIALVDHALRRRFAFLPLRPDYEVLRKYHSQSGFPVENLISVLKQLNGKINDVHYELGISFFMRQELSECIEDIWRMEIDPYLEEYFFDQREKADTFSWTNVKQKIFT